ncbi:MAG: M81 family metallopeptidase [Alphaproteobacteria bacterium]
MTFRPRPVTIGAGLVQFSGRARVRIALGGLWHETNTFASGRTALADFRAYQYAEGAEILARYHGTGTELGGMLAALRAGGAEPVPVVFAGAVPSGVIAREALDDICAGFERALSSGGPFDGALLVLHGAAVAEGIADADAHVLGIVRARLGARIPIAATFDYHANLSASMVARADVLVGYDTYPHTDMRARGEEAARLLIRMIQTGARPHKAHIKLPLLTAPIVQRSGAPPLSDVYARLHAAEAGPSIWCGSIAMGFPYSDIADLGASVLVYGDDAGKAEGVARDLAAALWDVRRDLSPRLVPPAEAVRRAVAASEGPVVLVDAADNVGGGSAGDGTAILAELLAQGARDAVVVIADEAAVRAARAVGEAFDFPVGGKCDALHGPPVRVLGRVRAIFAEARYRHLGSYMTGYETSMGAAAVVDEGGVRILLTARRTMPFDAGQLLSVGLDPALQRIIVVKSAIAWRAAYGAVAKSAIEVDTPGVCASNLARFAYSHRPRPVFPLEPDAIFEPAQSPNSA